MLIISDYFSPNAISAKGEGFDATYRVRRLVKSKLQNTVAALVKNHDTIKSVVSTKKNAEIFSKLLGINVEKFSSVVFEQDDFLRINKSAVLLFGEYHKKENDWVWYLMTIPESANDEQ